MRETADSRADRILVEGRLRVLTADESAVVADVRGSSGLYRVTLEYDRGQVVRSCTCLHSQMHPVAGFCSHMRALSRVWAPDLRGGDVK